MNARSRPVFFLCFALCLSFSMVVIAQDGTVSRAPNRFGVVEAFWQPERACELGVGWERIIFDWAQHQPNGPEDWHTLNVDDRWLKAASDCRREVVAVIKHVPEWATDGTPGVGVPRGLALPIDDPDNVWANFVSKLADYYASRGVNHIIMLNEPDITSDTYGYEFEGTLDDYYLMLKVGYLAAKKANPAAVIHLAGTTYWHDVNNNRRVYVDRLIERIQQDPEAEANDHYFDVLSLHVYFRTESVYDIVKEMRNMLDSYNLPDKAIWINETNAAPTDDPNWPVERPVFQLDLEQQASFLVQAAALGLAGGVERIAVYKLYDQNLPPGGESFGILSPVDASPRPAFYTWQMVTQHFDDVETAVLARGDGFDVVRLIHRDGRETLAAWTTTAESRQIRVDVSGNKAYRMDQYGNIALVRPVDGSILVNLTVARCNEVDGCPVGGPVTLLVQPNSNSSVWDVTGDQAVKLEFGLGD